MNFTKYTVVMVKVKMVILIKFLNRRHQKPLSDQRSLQKRKEHDIVNTFVANKIRWIKQ